MTIAFFGFQSFGCVTLRALVEDGRAISLVVTHPDAEDPYHRHFTESVAEFARAAGIRTIVTSTVTPEVVAAMAELRPEYLVSSNWRRVLPAEVLRAVSKEAFNVHRALLPRYAGLAPINWAIANGESRVGVTIHLMSEKVDLGDIVEQEGFDVSPTETATEVFARTNPVVARLIVSAVDKCDRNRMERRTPDPRDAVFYHARGERELRIDWQASRRAVFDLIRAQSDPFANAYTSLEGTLLKIKAARIATVCHRGTPSRVVHKSGDGSVVVLCGATADDPCQGLEIEKVAIDRDVARPAAEILRVGQYLG